ncbi:MAG: hypothetical protein Q9161_004265 [Pseudevernia consocians]
MFPPVGQLFRKNGRDFPAEPAGNEDLECGHGSSVPQTPTASGYLSSPSRVYLPETQSIHASTVPQTPTPSRQYFSHVQYNGQYGSAAQVPLTPSGPSKVVGYLPRTIYSDFSPFVGPTRLIMSSQPSQNTSSKDLVSNMGLPCRSTSISSTTSHRSSSPRSPFDSGKHGQALRRLETHGSLKTIPSGQQEGDALNRTSISWSEIGREIFEEDHAAGLDRSLLQRPEYQTSADPYETVDQQSGMEFSPPLIQYLPDSVYQPEVLSQGDSPKVVNLPDPPKSEGGQSLREALPSFVFPLPNSEVDSSYQVTEQALRRCKAPPNHHQALSSTSLAGESIAADASPDLWSKTQSSGKMPDIDEYLWSPAPSDDGQEASSGPHTPVPRHAPLDALRASPISGLTSDSHDGFSRSSNFEGNEHIHSRSGSSGNPCAIDSPLPYIDVLIPAGNIDLNSHSDLLSSSQHASTMGSRGSSSILFRYSGVITDGASSRPMSETELKEELLHSLGDRAKTGLSILSSRDSSSEADHYTSSEHIRGDHEPNARLEAVPLDRVQKISPDAGPGSSQTSSSLSTDGYGGDSSGHKAHLGKHSLPSSRTRCPTPPLLFGKHAISEPEKVYASPMPALGNTFSRFDHNAKTVRLQETGHMPTALCSLGEQDWETVSAKTEADTHAFNNIALNTKTGSSLADNSDSSTLSLSKETPYRFRGVKAHPVMQHPAHPRHNHSFVLLKNSQTGDLVRVPQYEYASGGRLPNSNSSAQLMSRVGADSTYQHPPPLQISHNHPFTSSPPTIGFENLSATNIEDGFESLSSGLSQDVPEVKEKQTQNSLYKTTQDVSRVCNPVVNQNQNTADLKEQSRQSSAWLSTVSEVTSSKPSLPEDGGTSAKMIVLNENRHVNGTPEQGGNREVGSSLADASSPGINFSSSPAPLASSPIHFPDTPPSLGQDSYKKAVRHGLDYGSQYLLGNLHKSLARSFNREDSATSIANIEDHSRSRSVSGPQLEHRKLSPRRRRPSSESRSRLMDSPSAQKASALNPLSSDGHAQQTTSSGLLLRNPFLHSDDNDSRYDSYQHNIIERRGRQPKADDASVDDPTTPSLTESRPFVRDGVVHTDVAPPILNHPVYGRDRPWDLRRPGHPCPRPHLNPLGRPLFQRPVARAESPHLHRIPHPPTPELLDRHELLSRIYLVSSMLLPPIAIVYGHGYMDGIMRLHTAGEFNGFCNTKKTIALCWGYGLSAMCILAIIIAMITISASG